MATANSQTGALVASADAPRSFGILTEGLSGLPASPCFFDLVKRARQVSPTAAQKKDRNRLVNPKASPVAALRPNILPINMVPPSYVPTLPGLKLPRTFTSLVNASMTRAVKKPIFMPISHRIRHTSDTARH